MLQVRQRVVAIPLPSPRRNPLLRFFQNLGELLAPRYEIADVGRHFSIQFTGCVIRPRFPSRTYGFKATTDEEVEVFLRLPSSRLYERRLFRRRAGAASRIENCSLRSSASTRSSTT